ncbi:quinone oxidoreductase [Pseudomonas syringae group genomosp. 3]|nr:quinone oxidoreductase [Pseudomonas syringae group genomosp. 3]
MKAIVTTKFGQSPQMAVTSRQHPQLKEGHSLIRMQAATINQLSNSLRKGTIGAASPPLVLGNEGSGVVEQSDRFPAGTRVVIYGGGTLGITEDGLYQQWAVVDDSRIFELPTALTFEEAAALPVNYLTAYLAATRTAMVKDGQYALVSGAAGSVGHALVQVLNALGARPIALVSTTRKATHALKAGAYASIDLSTQELHDEVARLTDGKGAELAFDPVGGDVTGEMMRSLATGGLLISIGFTGGQRAEINLVDVLVNEKGMRGYTVHAESAHAVRSALQTILEMAAAEKLKPVIDSSYPMESFEEAYTRLTSREAIGSIVVQLS